MQMKITLNDEVREIESGTTLAGLLGQLGLQAKFVAVEVNLEVVPRDRHGECVLRDGDQLELVTLVGGG
jgi:sulfur carrier protein